MEKRLVLSSYITTVADMFVNEDYEVTIFKSDYDGQPCIDLMIDPIGVIHYISGLNGIPQEYVFDKWYGNDVNFGEDSHEFLEHINNIIDEIRQQRRQ